MTRLLQHESKEILQRVPLFSRMTSGEVADIAARCVIRTFKNGQQILSPLQQADCFYIILSGKIRLYKLSGKGDQQLLHMYGPGNTFGEAAMWQNICFPAFAEAVEKSRVMSISRDLLREIIENNSDLAMNMLAGMSSKLHEFNRLIEQLSFRGVPARLAYALLEMPTTAGTNIVVLKETKKHLASRIGTIPETLSRCLAKLGNQGLISVNGKEITLLDTDGLEQLIDQDS